MREIFENVSASPRLRRFTTSYLMIYFIITLCVNLLVKYVPVLESSLLVCVKDLVVYFIEGSLLYGLMRGIVTKNYRFNEGIASFGETENYLLYLVYAVINTLYNAIYSLTGGLAESKGTIGTIGLVLSVILAVLRLIVNFGLVRLYFDRLLFGNNKVDILRVIQGCAKTLSDSPKRVISAEIMLLVVKYVSMLLGVAIVSVVSPGVGGHWSVSFITSCLVTVHFGAMVYVWPVYYLYYKDTCEM